MSTEETDKFVTLVASLKGHEQVRRRVRKDVIQSESAFLKEYIDDGATEIKIPLKRPNNLDLILKYLYEGQLTTTTSSEIHLESLWNDARILGLVNLQKVCVQRLTDTISLESWIQRLQFSQAEGCHELESNVLSFVNDNFEDCSSSSSFTSLSVDQMIQVLQLPTVKTTVTESNRIVLILDWIKANEVDRCSYAHHVLEQVDLTKLTENSLRLFFDEESTLRSWRSVALFERALKLKRFEETARQSVHGQPDESELIVVDPAAFESLESRLINIKQEVVAVEKSSDTEVNESNETMNSSGGSARERRIMIKREVSPPLPSSVGEAIENVDSNQDGPPLQKIPRQEYFQNEIESAVSSPPSQTDFVSKQKQILYFSQLSNGTRSLNFVTVSTTGAISAPQHLLATLPRHVHGIPKLIWDQETRNLCFFKHVGRKVPTFNYMNSQGAPKVTVLPKMLHQRHHYQPVLRNGCVYVFGGSKSLIYKNNDRLSNAEVLDMTTTALMSDWQWQPIAPMAAKRDLYAAACVEGNIYVIGGAVDRQEEFVEPVSTNKAVCYQPDQNFWTTIKPMCNRRCGHAVAVLGYNIYIFGGSGKNYKDFSKDCANMKSAEVYNVRQNVWKFIAPMRRPRYGGSALEIDGKIYVLGGDQSNQGESPSSVECYDPESNYWTLVSESVDDHGLFDSITVIDDPEYFLKG